MNHVQVGLRMTPEDTHVLRLFLGRSFQGLLSFIDYLSVFVGAVFVALTNKTSPQGEIHSSQIN